eukprot:4463798-Prymnesium_polylepis.1
MRPGDRSTSVFLWIMLRCKLLLEGGFITHIEFTHLLAAVTGMRQTAHDLMSRLSTDLPYPYASTIGYLVHIVVFLQVTKNALACAVLYPPLPAPRPSLSTITAAVSLAANASGLSFPEPEPEATSDAQPELVAEPERALNNAAALNTTALAGDSEAELIMGEPEAGINASFIGRLLSERAAPEPGAEAEAEPADPEPASQLSGWEHQAHMWILQLGCMLLWIMTYHAFFNIHSELHNPYGPRLIDVAHEVHAKEIRRLASILTEDRPEDALPPSLRVPIKVRDTRYYKGLADRFKEGSRRTTKGEASGSIRKKDGAHSSSSFKKSGGVSSFKKRGVAHGASTSPAGDATHRSSPLRVD